MTNAYSKGAIPLHVQGIANVKVSSIEGLLQNSVERFLDVDQAHIAAEHPLRERLKLDLILDTNQTLLLARDRDLGLLRLLAWREPLLAEHDRNPALSRSRVGDQGDLGDAGGPPRPPVRPLRINVHNGPVWHAAVCYG